MRKTIYLLVILTSFITTACKKENETYISECKNPNPAIGNGLLTTDVKFGSKPGYNSITKLLPCSQGFYFMALDNHPAADPDNEKTNDLLYWFFSNKVGLISKNGQIIWEKKFTDNVATIATITDSATNQKKLVAILSNPKPAEAYFEGKYSVKIYNETGNLLSESTTNFDNWLSITDAEEWPGGGVVLTGAYKITEPTITRYPMLIKLNDDMEQDTMVVLENFEDNWALRLIVQESASKYHAILAGGMSYTETLIINLSNDIHSPENWNVEYGKIFNVGGHNTFVQGLASAGPNISDGFYVVGDYEPDLDKMKVAPFVTHYDVFGEIVWSNNNDISDYIDIYLDCYFDEATQKLFVSGYHSHAVCDKKRLSNGFIGVYEEDKLVNRLTFGHEEHFSAFQSVFADESSIYFGGYINANSSKNGSVGWFGSLNK
jgi:hypothetical protein